MDMVSDSSQGSDQSCFPRIKPDSFQSSHSPSPTEKATQPSWHLFMFIHLWKRWNGPTVFFSAQQREKSSMQFTTAGHLPPSFYTVSWKPPATLSQKQLLKVHQPHTSLEKVNVFQATYSIYTAPLSLVPLPHNDDLFATLLKLTLP